MELINKDIVTEFIIIGFSSLREYTVLLFIMFLVVYLVTLIGNSVIFLTIKTDYQLNTPMYYFVSNLSVIDISYTSITMPKMLADFMVENKTIPFAVCIIQMYLFLSLGATECFLLSVMAFDRYAAICNPLHYTTVMTKTKCILLAAGAWLCGFLAPLPSTILLLKLPLCGIKIQHCFCDHPPILQLACTDISFNVAVGSSMSAIVIVLNCFLVGLSYVKIITAIFKINTGKRRKAFSTCSSHLIVVALYFGSITFMYIRPKVSYSFETDTLVAVLYSVLTPMLNPIIYSLRNKEIIVSLQKNLQHMLLQTKS
ncbi:olfactory receptor 6N2-like isoform X3 [Protopterus annectens]|uniref:olfactory receptor 6N2-like isoform X3 n=1 Tax=Protopterus annectens TaxID=7888 RepID=UPI001CF9B76C|nr:olfactory receptor 6N2-like isoform X3 [Protopterus annectens]